MPKNSFSRPHHSRGYTYAIAGSNGKVHGYAFATREGAEQMRGYINSNSDSTVHIEQLPFSNSEEEAQLYSNLLREADSYGDVKTGEMGSAKYRAAEKLRKSGLLGKPKEVILSDGKIQTRFPITRKGHNALRID